MRLKLSDKVLLNFFILPIFSAGCGSMRSHIWAARGPGNFAKLVQGSAAQRRQRRARARGAGKAAPRPAPPPPRGPRATRSARLAAGLGPGPRLGARGRLTWCRGRPRSPPPGGPRAAPPPAAFSLLCKREPRGRGRRGGSAAEEAQAAAVEACGTSSPARGAALHGDPRLPSPEAWRPGPRSDPAPRSDSDSEASTALPDPPRPGGAPSRPPALRPPRPRSTRALRDCSPRQTDRRTDRRTTGSGLRADPAHRCGAVRSVSHSPRPGKVGECPALCARAWGTH